MANKKAPDTIKAEVQAFTDDLHPGIGTLYRVILHIPGIGSFSRKPTTSKTLADEIAKNFNGASTKKSSILLTGTSNWTPIDGAQK